MAYYIFFIAICLVLAGVTIAGKDFWPFSHYPMFSIKQNLKDVKIWRVALEDKDGDIKWWQSTFVRYPEFTGRKLQKIYGLNMEGKKLSVFINVERDKLLKAVMKQVAHEQPESNYTAIHIIERTVADTFKISEKTIDTIPLPQLNGGSIK